MSNPYYDPEELGARIVAKLDWVAPNYSFDMTVIWRRADGALVMASDSGCSCPSPFQSTRLYDLTPMTRHEIAAALQADRAQRDDYELDDMSDANLAQAIETLMKEPA